MELPRKMKLCVFTKSDQKIVLLKIMKMVITHFVSYISKEKRLKKVVISADFVVAYSAVKKHANKVIYFIIRLPEVSAL